MTPTVAEIAKVLEEGGVVLIPTDTVLGLAASPTFPEAVDRIYALKQRPRDKNLPIMVANEDQIFELGADLSLSAAQLIASKFVPGALTLILPIDQTRAPHWLKDRVEIAVRIPNNDRLLETMRIVGPLMVTSANLSGEATPETTDDACAQLDGTPDLVVPGESAAPAPSTIVNCIDEPVHIERLGVVSEEEIAKVLECVI
ncbi:L-threonylcarbamoyladenylate synthase [Celeribacter litoreus]|uniref:L-threonylcarbamoyladenylate synthase n=1 Tax=Celeribacter litoreus TaxID=2876714 RepID=UPI001CCE740E|nr:L-threonylcarbamoyladenylate synthase [Celeribacter litoreus]MCA0042919.1 threonylcarbamoyl-AMP synthase [Celeribacter litoreus]